MTTTIQKWGNSLGVRLPKEMAFKLGLKSGSRVSIASEDESIIIKHDYPRLTLKQMLKGITKKNLHKEVDWGKPVKGEVW